MIGQIPDVYIKNQKLEEQGSLIHRELDKAKLEGERAKATWDKLRKERDFHKMHHHRVQQEKEKLNKDIEKLKSLHTVYEQKYQELSTKYEAAMKEKMLVRLERDRLHAKTEALNKSLRTMEDKITRDDLNIDIGLADEAQAQDGKKGAISKKRKDVKLTAIPIQDRPNPYLTSAFEAFPTKNLQMAKNFEGHMMAISTMAIHPRKPFLATASDDLTWKIWSIPNGELIMSGEGHKDWVSGIDFHPRGSH
jgi:hypothetical protein